RLPAAAAAMTGGFLTLFGCLVIPSQATTRALIFMGCVLVALAMARRASARHVLAFALAVVVLLEPTAALGPSCQLSFCAAAALILSAPDARRLDGWLQEPGRLPYWLPVYAVRPLAGLCWVNLVTFGATAPLTLAWFGQIAWSGLWVNLVAVPLMSFVVLPVGALWLLLAALVPSMALWLSPVPEVAAVGFVSLLGTVGADAPSAVVGAWPIWSGVLGASGVVLVLARRPTWGGALVAASILVAACLPVGGGPPGEWRTTFLDVGHGDAIAIQTPTGATMLVDAGGTWQGGDADRRLADRAVLPALLAMGWQRLDRLVISHADRDHIAGALPIAQRLPVGQLWLPPCAITDWRAKQLMDHVVARGGSVHVLHQGSTSRWQGLKIETLWPPFDARTPDGSCRWSANEGSLVLRLSAHGRSLLLTGDIEADAEATLVESREALAADVLKVAHHGSKSSSTDVFIAAVGADHAVVSGLPGRLPMPPHPVVLNRLSETATVWVTGTQGAVTMRVQADGAFEMSALSQESRDQLRDLLRRLKRREVTGLEDLGKDAP
ncbi:MAG: competence protein ComEC, partial [Myxococcota bacterium]